MKVEEIFDEKNWENAIEDFGGHPLQSWGWGELKTAHNWSAKRFLVSDDGKNIGGAQVLIRKLPAPFNKMAYIPRGPFGDDAKVSRELGEFLKDQGFMYLCAEPDLEKVNWEEKWQKSSSRILVPSTLILDLEKTQDDLLADMTKKTRQYIRKSERDGVKIHQLNRDELPTAMEIYHDTADRAGFALHGDDYYYDCADKLGERSIIFGAFHDEKLVSFVWLAVSGSTAFELYGGMNDDGQKVRANYALKWHAIRECQRWGVRRYDMNGLLNDGISTFKRGFASHEDLLAGEYDFVYSPIKYWLWLRALPLAKKVLKFIKRSK